LPTSRELFAQAKPVGNVRLLTAVLKDVSPDDLRKFGDDVKGEAEPLVAFLASTQEGGKLQLVCAVSQNLVAKNWHARELFALGGRARRGGQGAREARRRGVRALRPRAAAPRRARKRRRLRTADRRGRVPGGSLPRHAAADGRLAARSAAARTARGRRRARAP